MDQFNNRKDKLEIAWMKLVLKGKRFFRTRFGSYLWQIVSSLAILAVTGGIGVFAAYAQTQGSAETYAKEYFNAFMTHGWSVMFKETDLVPSKYINEDSFGKMMNCIVPSRGSEKYEFVDRGTDGTYQLIDVVYRESGSEIDKTMTLYMKKKEEKIALVLNQWEVALTQDIIRNCKISAPSYVTVFFDGVSLTDCPFEEADGVRTYTLDRVLAGTHQLELSTYGTNISYETVFFQESGECYQVQASEYPLNSATTALCGDTAIDIIVNMYTGVLTNGGCESVKELLITDEEKADVDAVYASLLSQISREDGATLVSMSFDSYHTEILEYVPADSLAVAFYFQTTFQAKSGRGEMGGVRENYQGTTESVGIVRFVCRDGNWVPHRVELGCFDYSKPPEEPAT